MGQGLWTGLSRIRKSHMMLSGVISRGCLESRCVFCAPKDLGTSWERLMGHIRVNNVRKDYHKLNKKGSLTHMGTKKAV